MATAISMMAPMPLISLRQQLLLRSGFRRIFSEYKGDLRSLDGVDATVNTGRAAATPAAAARRRPHFGVAETFSRA